MIFTFIPQLARISFIFKIIENSIINYVDFADRIIKLKEITFQRQLSLGIVLLKMSQDREDTILLKSFSSDRNEGATISSSRTGISDKDVVTSQPYTSEDVIQPRKSVDYGKYRDDGCDWMCCCCVQFFGK